MSFIFALIVSFLLLFICVFKNHTLSAKKKTTYFTILYDMGLLAMNSFSFCLSEKVYIMIIF